MTCMAAVPTPGRVVSDKVEERPCVVGAPAVACDLPHVAGRVIEPEGVRRKTGDRSGELVPVVTRIRVRELRGPVGAVGLAAQRADVVQRKAIRPIAGCAVEELEFDFGRQMIALACPAVSQAA
jgi:hypothetical protein